MNESMQCSLKYPKPRMCVHECVRADFLLHKFIVWLNLRVKGDVIYLW